MLAKVYDQYGVFANHSVQGIVLENVAYGIEAAPFSGVLQIVSAAYNAAPRKGASNPAPVVAAASRRSLVEGDKGGDAKVVAAFAAAAVKAK